MRTARLAALALLSAGCAHTHDEFAHSHELRAHPHDAVAHSHGQVAHAHDLTAHSHPASPHVHEEFTHEHPAPSAETTADGVAATLALRRPEDAYRRRGEWDREEPSDGDKVSIPFPERGMGYPEFFDLVSREAGVRIRYETLNQLVKHKRVAMVGPTRVARDDLIAWAQDTCLVGHLLLIPHGPAERREYVVLDTANAKVTTLATFVTEDQLPALAHRSGLYVNSVLTLPDGLDPVRAVRALSVLSTKTAGLGRIANVAEDMGAVGVADFATVVANMRRVLDEMAIERYERGR